MKVYRVALPPMHIGNSQGKWIGPYNARSGTTDDKVLSVSARLCREHSNDEHPNPFIDVPGGINAHEVCVFSTIQQMEQWFESFGFDLREAGYKVLTYDTLGEVREGRYQTVAVVADDEIISIEDPLGYIE